VDIAFSDTVSGKSIQRPQLAALPRVRPGRRCRGRAFDGPVGPQSRGSPSAGARADDPWVRVRFVKEQLSFSAEDSPMATLLLSVLGAFAEFERALIRERQAEGIALAKARGASTGRKRSLTPAQASDLRARVAAGEPKASLARKFGISRQTLYQYLRPTEPGLPAGPG